MFGSILHRMIFWELVKVFTLSLVGITGIMLMGGVVAEASKTGISAMQVPVVIGLLIPSFLPYTVPATTLFAACVVYGRLSADNEILAMKAAGLNIVHVIRPGVILGLVLSVATMALSYRIIPYSHHLLRSMFLNDVEAVLYNYLKKDGEIKQPKLNYAIYVRRVEGRKLIGAIFKKRDANGVPGVVIAAKEAELQVDMQHHQIRVFMKNGEVCGTSGVEGVFMEKMQEEELPPSFGNVYEAPPRDLSWRQILEQRHDTLERLRYFDEDISNTETVPPAHHRPEKIPEHIKNLVNKRAVYQGKLLQLDAELQMRPALAAGCLCFMLVGCPVGIWCSRSDYLSAFITGFLPVVFVYYPLLLAGVNLAKEGRFIPDACIWAADGLMGLVGIVLFWRLLKN